MSQSPLIVLNALVIRADSQAPEEVRRARPGYNVNKAGEGVEESGTLDRRLALTEKPQLEWEAFDEYWRKVHGPKILHRDGPSDRQTELLTYYLQQHRIPAGPTSQRAPPYAPKLTAAGVLPTSPAADCESYQRPAWDGIAQLGYSSKRDLEAFFNVDEGKYGDKIVPDEAVFIRGFGFHVAEEHVVFNRGDRRRDPIILIRAHVRNADYSRERFRGYWMTQHADMLNRLPSSKTLIRRYAQLVNISEAGDRLYDEVGDRIDGIGVMSFANMNDVEDFLSGSCYAALAADEQNFASGTSFFTALNYVIQEPNP